VVLKKKPWKGMWKNQPKRSFKKYVTNAETGIGWRRTTKEDEAGTRPLSPAKTWGGPTCRQGGSNNKGDRGNAG